MINFKKLQSNDLFYYSLIFAVSVLIISPALLIGVPAGSVDFIHHLQISYAFFDSISQGNLFPNWVFAENNGYGAVTVRFYPPLIGYTLAIFRYLTGDWQFALFSAFTFWSFVGGLGVYTWSRQLLGKHWQAFCAALIFMLAPYHLAQFYLSFMFGEFVAISIMPFAFFFAKNLCERNRLTDVLGFAAATSLLILSNLPQMVIAAVSLGLYALLYLNKTDFVRQAARFAAAALLALAATSFYWVRMVSEMYFINVSQPNTDPDYDYRNHFLLSTFQIDQKEIWFVTLMVMISVFLVVLALTLSGKIKSAWQNPEIRKVLILSGFSFFMMISVSRLVWDHVEPLQKVQFPWRFFTILTLGASVLIAYSLDFINPSNYVKKRPLILLLSGALLIYAAFSIKQVALGAVFYDLPTFNKMRTDAERGEGLPHWLPTWVAKTTFEKEPKISIDGREAAVTVWENETREFSVAAGASGKLRVPLIYYPHWKATINGLPAEVLKGADGTVNLDLPENFSNVRLFFEEPLPSLWSRKVSVAAWFLMLMIFFTQRLFSGKPLPYNQSTQSS